MANNIEIIESFVPIVGANYVETSSWKIQPFIKGWRYGHGNAIAVIKPGNLLELWNVLKICVKYDLIILMQAANTGLTGGSTPYGDDYDRPLVIINTLRINDIHIIKDGNQIISFPGSTLYELEKKLEHFNREPHSVIGSTSIGASIIGGICNNSGGSLVHRGPAFTELALYAQINEIGELELVNELGINLGKKPEEILLNLENINYKNSDFKSEQKRASDQDYEEIVRGVDKNTPARFNSDTRLLYGVSGSAGKLAVFAVRLDTYKAPKKKRVFYLGTNKPDDFWKIRREILKNFKTLPRLGDYLHRECYDAAKKYSKDTFIVIEKLGTRFLPILFEFKRIVDIIAEKTKFLPNKFSDRLMQFISELLPNHLTKKMDEFRDRFEHHWIIEMTDEGIDEAKDYFINYFKDSEADFFICNKKEEKKVMLHRYVSASAVGRYHALSNKKCGDMISLDVAYPRNEKNLLYKLPKEIEDKIEMNLCYGHLFCHVLHQNYIVKKGEDGEKIKNYLLNICKDKGAEYPAEHNVGHEYKAKSELSDFYKKLDPTNTFNPGIGKTSKLKNWK
jgi:D-lactate dehydrogenase